MKRKLPVLLILLSLSVLLCAGIIAAGNIGHVEAEGALNDMEQVEIWKRTDIILLSEKSYSNPYREVDIDADFVHEDGTKIHLYGFWNGDNEWRVRFSPTKTGVWTYTITCNDTENAALHGATGKILAVENTGTTDIDKHGFVKISDNGRYFVHDDGTPFYWLGDTNWQAPSYVSITQCNYPGCDCQNQFTHEVNDRLAKGFTVYQTYFDTAEGDGGGQRGVSKEPSLWTSRYSRINPKTFTEKVDVMFDYLADHGMVIALGYGVHNSTVSSMPKKELDRVSRYFTARYASYPIIWITAQEITGKEQFDGWVSSARIVCEGDGYDHPQGAHMYPLPVDNEFVVKLDEESWHQYYALQCGHGPTYTSKHLYQGYWENTRSGKVKPFVETEANYEDITCGGFNGYAASRIAAWKANLCGSYGFTYGVTGVWANCYSTAGNTGWMGSYSFEPWYMGIDKPGSFEMTYLKDFFKYVDFSRLVPRFSDATYSDLKAETKVISSSENGDTYVAYFYNTDLSTGELRGLSGDRKYSAKWYDPRTGCFVPISDNIKIKNGVYTIPEKPTAGDWAILVTSRTDLGDYVTETAYSDEILDPVNSPLAKFRAHTGNQEGNILADAIATASSFSDRNSTPDKALDGDKNTWWCAQDGEFPQHLMLEMPEARSFNTVSFSMYPRTGSAAFVVEGSNDGTNWDKLAEQDSLPERMDDVPVFICSLNETVSYKFIKITFFRVNSNWSAVLEAAAYIDEVRPARTIVPEYKGTLDKPSVFCSGSYIYDARGKSKDTIDALFDGDPETLWKPFAPIASQTIMMDLGESKALFGMNIKPGPEAFIPEYRIEGSNDGKLWTILSDATLRSPAIYYPEEGKIVSESLWGAFRYVKLIWLGAGSNTADKTIAGIELYTGDASEADENPNATAVPEDPKDVAKNKAWPVIVGVLGVAALAAATVVLVSVLKGKKE